MNKVVLKAISEEYNLSESYVEVCWDWTQKIDPHITLEEFIVLLKENAPS